MMKKIFSLLKKEQPPIVKKSLGTAAYGFWASPSPRRDLDYIKEGYWQNVVVYRCIKEIAECISSLPFYLCDSEGEELPETHLAYGFFKSPNPTQGFDEFTKAIITYYLIVGNGYGFATNYETSNPLGPGDVWAIPSHLISVRQGKYSPESYDIHTGNSNRNLEFLRVPPNAIFDFKHFNPMYPQLGSSPLEAATLDIDINNKARQLNLSLINNGGRPSGVLSSEGELSVEQIEELRQQLKEMYLGAENAGRPLLLQGGLKWEQIGAGLGEIDFAKGLDLTARQIASALGVPFQLVTPEASTYNNMEQARLNFIEQTVLPLAEVYIEQLLKFLKPFYPVNKRDFFIKIDQDSIRGLEARRTEKFNRILEGVKAGVITINEARESLDFERIESPAADSPIVPASMTPLDGLSFELPVDMGDVSNAT